MNIGPARDQLEILRFMYSKHLVSPSSIERELAIGGQGQRLTEAELVLFDQDHFGGAAATYEPAYWALVEQIFLPVQILDR